MRRLCWRLTLTRCRFCTRDTKELRNKWIVQLEIEDELDEIEKLDDLIDELPELQPRFLIYSCRCVFSRVLLSVWLFLLDSSVTRDASSIRSVSSSWRHRAPRASKWWRMHRVAIKVKYLMVVISGKVYLSAWNERHHQSVRSTCTGRYDTGVAWHETGQNVTTHHINVTSWLISS